MIYLNLWDSASALKALFFFVFFLLTIAGRNEAVIVELKALFVL